jgi:aspartyl-tRNA(Asn)/glutamyl-tRNA(Gln) amidotransferase subunit B
LEIVTAPDFKSSEEVALWLRDLLHHLAYLRAVQRDAGIKVDVNVSTIRKGKPTERVEVKNVNSVENIVAAIEYELERQEEEGSQQETRGLTGKEKDVVMRTKENAADYRFISDPDLKAIVIGKELVSSLEKKLPEMPGVKIEKITSKFGLSKTDAGVLARHLEIVEFFESVADRVGGQFARDWVIVELLRHLNYNKTSLDAIDIKVDHLLSCWNWLSRRDYCCARA